MSRIICQHIDASGAACGRFLGEVVDDRLRIYCVKCQSFHEVPLTQMIVELEAWLHEVKALQGRRVLVGSL